MILIERLKRYKLALTPLCFKSSGGEGERLANFNKVKTETAELEEEKLKFTSLMEKRKRTF